MKTASARRASARLVAMARRFPRDPLLLAGVFLDRD